MEVGAFLVSNKCVLNVLSRFLATHRRRLLATACSFREVLDILWVGKTFFPAARSIPLHSERGHTQNRRPTELTLHSPVVRLQAIIPGPKLLENEGGASKKSEDRSHGRLPRPPIATNEQSNRNPRVRIVRLSDWSQSSHPVDARTNSTP